MKSLIMFALALVVAPCVVAQEGAPNQTQEPDAPLEHRVVNVQHYRASDFSSLLFKFVQVQAVDELRAVSMIGTREQLDAAEAAIRQLDVPVEPVAREPRPRSMELFVYYVGVGLPGRDIPDDSPLGAVVRQLRRNFDYADYKLISGYMVRATQGKEMTSVRGSMPLLESSPVEAAPGVYHLEFGLVGFFRSADGDWVATLREVAASWQLPVKGSARLQEISLSTGVDLPEGKMVVLGKAGLPGNDSGIFVVLEARPEIIAE